MSQLRLQRMLGLTRSRILPFGWPARRQWKKEPRPLAQLGNCMI
jgi:hypothetical protein